MFYYLYQVTNKINNKIYVGVHKTSNLDDGYMGSGKVIKSAISKYGEQNFEKSILEFFSNEEEMFKREMEIVNEEFLLRDDVYNLRRGGFGGFDYLNSIKTFEDRSKMGKKCHANNPNLARENFSCTDEEKLKRAAKATKTKKRRYGEDYFVALNKDKPKSDEHKQKIRLAALQNQHLYENVKCPHCEKVGSKNAMLRYHFNKCKQKPVGI